ncbi:MAG: FkbM family methyltransferase [Gammaproteobacteria bacterium]
MEKTFYVDSDGADSSLFMPANFENEIKINCNRLDNLQFNKTNIKLLKLEAEGAEPEIIKGAGEILKKTEFVSADLGPERGIDSLEHMVQLLIYYTKITLD